MCQNIIKNYYLVDDLNKAVKTAKEVTKKIQPVYYLLQQQVMDFLKILKKEEIYIKT